MHPYGIRIFYHVRYPNAFLHTALITGYATDGLFRESVLAYGSMRREGIRPVTFTLTASFRACASEKFFVFGRQIHRERQESEVRWVS